MRTIARLPLVVAFAALAPAAFAHPGEAHVHGFGDGLAHPLTGLDHMLAMLAVGLWAAMRGGRSLWALPAAFVGATIAGAGLAGAVAGLPAVETGVALSVVVLGALVASSAKFRLDASAALVAAFALFHGYAHGTEIAPGANGYAYGAGFVLATAALHAAGIGAGLLLTAATKKAAAVRIGGGAVAAAGVAMILGLL